MFMIILRILIILGLILGGFLLIVKQGQKIVKQDKRRTKLEEALMNIEETLQEVNILPEINKKKLTNAREHINEILEEGTEVLEFKTGPYFGVDKDKEFFA